MSNALFLIIAESVPIANQVELNRFVTETINSFKRKSAARSGRQAKEEKEVLEPTTPEMALQFLLGSGMKLIVSKLENTAIPTDNLKDELTADFQKINKLRNPERLPLYLATAKNVKDAEIFKKKASAAEIIPITPS